MNVKSSAAARGRANALSPMLVALLALMAGPIFAESLTVSVIDGDLEIPLEGARVELTAQGFETVTADTDAEGNALLALPEGFTRGTVAANIPGYAAARKGVKASDGSVVLALSISDIIEGRELVVERSAPGKTDEQTGVSVAMDREEMDTVANIGLVEDIMSAVSTLPGVGFTGGWNSQPSIRGGYPEEMGTVMDGVYLAYPWHWGGAFSIFNPYMVSSAKMSNGVFSARYGRAMSGLLEVTTLTPEPGQVRVEGGVSTLSTDAFAQIPFSDRAGLLIGGKVTYLDTLAILNDYALHAVPDLSETIPTMPFIRDLYAKGNWSPSPRFNATLNGFFGSDGIGIHADTEGEGMTNRSDFNWLSLQGFIATEIKWMPTDTARLTLQGGWNNQTMDMEMYFDRFGSRTYSDAFIEKYDSALYGDTNPGDGFIENVYDRSLASNDFNIDPGSLEFKGFSRQILNQAQGKLETEFQIAESHTLTFGAEEVFQAFRSEQEISGWSLLDDPVIPGVGTYAKINLDNNVEGNRTVDTAAYALWNFGGDSSAVSSELGLRAEHFYLWNKDYEFNTYPVFTPRANLFWRPSERLTLSAGTGLFSMVPLDTISADPKYGVKSFEAGPNRAWFSVIGGEVKFGEGWSFRLDTFYKQWYDRLYISYWIDPVTKETLYAARTDGTGLSTGFDLMLRKKTGRFWDGYLTYSFVTARFLNPLEPRVEGQTTANGEPLGRWYYPSYHRFHSLNLILNWKPVNGLTFTAKTSVASGTPKAKAGAIEMYAAIGPDGTVIEQYRREETYDDDLRTDLSCPVDLRVSFSNYYRNSKVRWEYYVGAEDVFVNLYSPKTNSSFDSFTGEEQPDGDNADFGIGIPQISIGYKLSY